MRYTTIILLLFILSSFGPVKNTDPLVLGHNELSCYKMRSKTVSHADYNIWVITNKAALEENFLADSCAGGLNFDEYLVVALKLETNTATYKTSISRVTSQAGIINVYFTTKRLKIPVEEGSPLELAEFKKDGQVKQIKFYHGEQLVRTVPLVSVY